MTNSTISNNNYHHHQQQQQQQFYLNIFNMKQPIVSATMTFLLVIMTLITLNSFTSAFSLSTSTSSSGTELKVQNNDDNLSRRSFFQSSSSAFLMSVLSTNPQLSYAAEESKNNNNNNNNESKTDQESLPSVQAPLYYILRVREATEQESRLIKSGKFKDVQRANVKLAVKFMLDNYRLNDNFISASAFLDGERKIKAADIGQSTVQNLITILEYFDSSDVENIKVCCYIVIC